MDLKPQFKVGGQFGCLSADYGIGDLREGLKFDMSFSAQAQAEAMGQSIEELHKGIQQALCEKAVTAGQAANSWGFGSNGLPSDSSDSGALAEALDTVGKILSTSATQASSRVTHLASACGLDVETFKRALEEEPPSPMTLRAIASTGVGMNLKLCMGWSDLQGYRMVGVGTKLTTGLTLGGDAFAGRHCSGTSLKILIAVSNFAFEYTIPVRTEEKTLGDNTTANPTASS